MNARLQSRRIAGILCAIFIATLFAWGAAILPPVPVVHAATTWHVTSNADGAETPGNCPGASCRLRDAIKAASSGDTIDFLISLPATITLISGTLNFSNLTINGSTTSTISISGNNAVGVFSIGGVSNIRDLTIRDGNAAGGTGGGISFGAASNILTLTNTIVMSNSADSAGGVWDNAGTLILISSTVSNNVATTGPGGGLYINAPSSSLSMTNSSVSGNAASNQGGGIIAGGPVTITGGSVTSNTAGYAACLSCSGGGIYKVGDSTMLLTNVNISGNTVIGANAQGAGIQNSSSSSLQITGGIISNNVVTDTFSNGGGIFHTGTGSATISGTLIVSNTAGLGGGIGNGNNTTMTVMNATIISNTARFGGGINNLPGGKMTLNGSTIQANSASNFGGGITNGGPLTITNSTISSNQTTGGGAGGAGIYVQGSGSALTVTNSTISSNQSSTNGGGIYADNSANTKLIHATITNNSAVGSAGGIYSHSSVVTTTVTNSIIAGNPAPSGSPDCFGPIGSGGYNLIGNKNGCTFSAVGSDQVGTNATPINPKLSGLASWSGSTQTHGLLLGSPALDQIPPATNGCGTTYMTDQRNFSRPQNTNCDIGAFEGFLYGIYLPLVLR